MKISKMDKDATYLLCPDKNCKLFWDKSQSCPCEQSCPHKDKLIKLIICWGCRELIELPGDHNKLCRVDHNCSNSNREQSITFSSRQRFYPHR